MKVGIGGENFLISRMHDDSVQDDRASRPQSIRKRPTSPRLVPQLGREREMGNAVIREREARDSRTISNDRENILFVPVSIARIASPPFPFPCPFPPHSNPRPLGSRCISSKTCEFRGTIARRQRRRRRERRRQ